MNKKINNPPQGGSLDTEPDECEIMHAWVNGYDDYFQYESLQQSTGLTRDDIDTVFLSILPIVGAIYKVDMMAATTEREQRFGINLSARIATIDRVTTENNKFSSVRQYDFLPMYVVWCNKLKRGE